MRRDISLFQMLLCEMLVDLSRLALELPPSRFRIALLRPRDTIYLSLAGLSSGKVTEGYRGYGLQAASRLLILVPACTAAQVP